MRNHSYLGHWGNVCIFFVSCVLRSPVPFKSYIAPSSLQSHFETTLDSRRKSTGFSQQAVV